MMWPSQNFLLYNGTVIKMQVNEWINTVGKKSIRALEIFRVQKLILNATS